MSVFTQEEIDRFLMTVYTQEEIDRSKMNYLEKQTLLRDNMYSIPRYFETTAQLWKCNEVHPNVPLLFDSIWREGGAIPCTLEFIRWGFLTFETKADFEFWKCHTPNYKEETYGFDNLMTYDQLALWEEQELNDIKKFEGLMEELGMDVKKGINMERIRVKDRKKVRFNEMEEVKKMIVRVSRVKEIILITKKMEIPRELRNLIANEMFNDL